MAEQPIRALILTEAGHGRGNGHLSRCTGLWEALVESGVEARLCVDTATQLPEGIVVGDWKRNLDRFLPAGATHELITVVDSYEADAALLNTIAARSRGCCFFDDDARLDYPDGILVNAAANADSLYPIRHSGTRYLTGTRYASLRKPFWKRRLYHVHEKIEQVMIFLGSAIDTEDALKVADCIRRLLPEARIMVLDPHTATSIPKDLRNTTRLLWLSEPERLADFAMENDVAVCAGGQMLPELACLGIPAITVLTADNQKANILGFQRSGYSIDAGPLTSSDRSNRLRAAIEELLPASRRLLCSSLGRNLVDGQGSTRIARVLTEMD